MRFSEVVRRVKSDGPQHVTVRGREEVVVITAEEFGRLRGAQTGQALIDAFRSCPYRDLEIEPSRSLMPFRDRVSFLSGGCWLPTLPPGYARPNPSRSMILSWLRPRCATG
jgi:prevent-host-death family protein